MISEGYWFYVKCIKTCPGFELSLLYPFPMMITISSCVPI